MLQLSEIEAQITKLGIKKTYFCKPEIRELQHILMDHEQIQKFVSGRYHGGFAILAATEQRLLLVDKKPLYLTVEDIRYDMISEIDMSARLFDATVTLFTVNKQLVFTSVKQQHLRGLTAYVQQRVMDIRQYQHSETPVPVATSQLQDVPLPPAPQSYALPRPGLLSVPARVITQVAHSPKAVGSAAILGAHMHHPPNPFTRAPMTVHKHWSSLSS